jgi:hypothetical protein
MGFFLIRWFGASDASERPDAPTLAARAAGHAWVGRAGFDALHLGGVPGLGPLSPGLSAAVVAALYAAFEFWQWWREPRPARWADRIPKRYDAAADWAAVSLIGAGAGAASAVLAGGAVWAVAGLSVAAVLGLAALGVRART